MDRCGLVEGVVGTHGCAFGGNQAEERCPVPVRLPGFVIVPDLKNAAIAQFFRYLAMHP